MVVSCSYWSIELNRFPDGLLTVLTNINEWLVKRLTRVNIPFDSGCVNELAQVVTCNKKMENLCLSSSPL